MQDLICVPSPELRVPMALNRISDWLKEYGGQVASAFVIIGTLLGVCRA